MKVQNQDLTLSFSRGLFGYSRSRLAPALPGILSRLPVRGWVSGPRGLFEEDVHSLNRNSIHLKGAHLLQEPGHICGINILGIDILTGPDIIAMMVPRTLDRFLAQGPFRQGTALVGAPGIEGEVRIPQIDQDHGLAVNRDSLHLPWWDLTDLRHLDKPLSFHKPRKRKGRVLPLPFL